MSARAGNSIRSSRSPAVSAARRDDGLKAWPPTSNGNGHASVNHTNNSSGSYTNRGGPSVNNSVAHPSSAASRSQNRSSVLPNAAVSQPSPQQQKQQSPSPPAAGGRGGAPSALQRRLPTHSRNIPFHSGSHRSALPPAVLPRPQRGASQPQLPAVDASATPQSALRQRANSHNVTPPPQQQQRQTPPQNSPQTTFNSSSLHTSVGGPVPSSAPAAYPLPRERGVYPSPHGAARPSPPPTRVPNDVLPAAHKPNLSHHHNSSYNNNNNNNTSAGRWAGESPRGSGSYTSPQRQANGAPTAVAPAPQQQQQRYAQPSPPRVQARAGGVYLESMDAIPKAGREQHSYASAAPSQSPRQQQQQQQRRPDYSVPSYSNAAPTASTAVALRPAPPSAPQRRPAREHSHDHGTSTDDLEAYTHATPPHRAQPAPPPPRQQPQPQRYYVEEEEEEEAPPQQQPTYAVTQFKPAPQQQQQQQQYAVRPADYYALAPSLRLQQNRHVRRIVAGEIERTPPQPRYVAPPSQDWEDVTRADAAVDNRGRVAAPAPHRGPPPPASQHPQQQQQQQRLPNPAPRADMEASTSLISETSSTRSSRSRQVFRRPQQQQQQPKQRVFMTGALPAGSPYGAKPTYAVVMPRTHRVPAGLYAPPSLPLQEHHHHHAQLPPPPQQQQQQQWDVSDVEPTVEEPYLVLDEEGGRVVEYEPDLPSPPAPPPRQRPANNQQQQQQQQQPVRRQPRPQMSAPPSLPPHPHPSPHQQQQYAERPVPLMRQVIHYYPNPQQQQQQAYPQDFDDAPTASSVAEDVDSYTYSEDEEVVQRQPPPPPPPARKPLAKRRRHQRAPPPPPPHHPTRRRLQVPASAASHPARTPSNNSQQAPPPTLPPPRPLQSDSDFRPLRHRPAALVAEYEYEDDGDTTNATSDRNAAAAENSITYDSSSGTYPTHVEANRRPSAQDYSEQPSSATLAAPLRPAYRMAEYNLYLEQQQPAEEGEESISDRRLAEGEGTAEAPQRQQQRQQKAPADRPRRRPRVQPHQPASLRASSTPEDAQGQSLSTRTQVTTTHRQEAPPRRPLPPPPPQQEHQKRQQPQQPVYPADVPTDNTAEDLEEAEEEEAYTDDRRVSEADIAEPASASQEDEDDDEAELEVAAETMKESSQEPEAQPAPSQPPSSGPPQRHLIVQDPHGSQSLDLDSTIDPDDLLAQQEAKKLAAELVRQSLLPPTPYVAPQPMGNPAPYSDEDEDEEELEDEHAQGGAAAKDPSTKAKKMLVHTETPAAVVAASQEEAVVVSAEESALQPTQTTTTVAAVVAAEQNNTNASPASVNSEVPHSVHVVHGQEEEVVAVVSQDALVQQQPSLERLDLASSEKATESQISGTHTNTNTGDVAAAAAAAVAMPAAAPPSLPPPPPPSPPAAHQTDVRVATPKPPEELHAVEGESAVQEPEYPQAYVHVPHPEGDGAMLPDANEYSNSLRAPRRESREDATEEDVDVTPASDNEESKDNVDPYEEQQQQQQREDAQRDPPLAAAMDQEELAPAHETQLQQQLDKYEELDLPEARSTQRPEDEAKLAEEAATEQQEEKVVPLVDAPHVNDHAMMMPATVQQLATPMPQPVVVAAASLTGGTPTPHEQSPEQPQAEPEAIPPVALTDTTPNDADVYDDEAAAAMAGEESVGMSPLDLGERYGYVDPLEEAAMDAAYMLDTLEDQYVRINEETGEEMEDLVHVVELNRYDRAVEPRYFVPKGQYSDVLPLLRYPATTTTTGADGSSDSNVVNTALTYVPLSEAGYVNLCAVVWLSRFHSEDIARLLRIAQGPAASAPPHEGTADEITAESFYYFDHPSCNLLEQLDDVVAQHVRSVVDDACGRSGDAFATGCARLTDRNNLAYLPAEVWQQRTTASQLHVTSMADHVTEVLLTATVPQEAARRQAARRAMSSDLQLQAQLRWPLFLGALPWNYEEVVEAETFAAMPTAAARLAYAFMYKARMRNLEGGLGSLTFSALSAQIPDAAVMDSLLMQEKLRLALLYSYKNVAACCALRQKAVKGHCVSSSLGNSQVAERDRSTSLDDLNNNTNNSNNNNPSNHNHSGWNSPVFSGYMQLWEGDKKATVESLPQEEKSAAAADFTLDDTDVDVVDLYSIAVQLSCFFPTKTERGMHQLCAALIEDLISMDALVVPDEVCTPEGIVLTDRTAIVDALVVEGAQAMRHIITTLSEIEYVTTISTDDYVNASSGRTDVAGVRAAMQRYLVLFDPGVMYFLCSPVPVDDLFQYVRSDCPPSLQPHTLGRKSTFVEVLRLQHIAETIQYAMEMQDAILVASQYNHLVAVHYKRIKQQLKARPTPRSVAEELQLDNVVVGQSMDLILNAAPLLSREHETNASLLAELTSGSGTNNNKNNNNSKRNGGGGGAGGAEADDDADGDEDVMLGQDEDGDGASGDEVLLRAVLVALCSADPQKPIDEVQDYLRHLLALYSEIRDENNNPVDGSDPLQVAQARATAAELACVDWFGQTNRDGTLMPGAAPARCDSTRVNAEELAALCPRVLGRRVGLPSSAVADAAAVISASAQAFSTQDGGRYGDGVNNDEDCVVMADTAARPPLAR